MALVNGYKPKCIRAIPSTNDNFTFDREHVNSLKKRQTIQVNSVAQLVFHNEKVNLINPNLTSCKTSFLGGLRPTFETLT